MHSDMSYFFPEDDDEHKRNEGYVIISIQCLLHVPLCIECNSGILAPLSHHIQIPISSSLVFKRIGQVCVVVDNMPLYI